MDSFGYAPYFAGQAGQVLMIDYWVVGSENDEVGGQDFGF
jgi:hypothetical protein